jgi:hypothetical protein
LIRDNSHLSHAKGLSLLHNLVCKDGRSEK